MDEIELKLHDMSSTLQPVDAYALVLEEVNGNRKLPVIIGSLEAKAIRIKMLNYKLPRPWTHDLFLSLTRELGVTLKKIFFDNAGEEIKIDSRTSDAVALALRYKCPIYTTAQIMDEEHLREESDSSFSVTVNMVGISVLKEALTKAIAEENYEQASRLRDEIRRREELKKQYKE